MGSLRSYNNSRSREVLAEGTVNWGSEGLAGHEAYLAFMKAMGTQAVAYDTYFSCAITNGGYARNDALPFAERVELNTDYCLLMADELAENGNVALEEAVDAVALGKVAEWQQTDYLAFFLNVMARPTVYDSKQFGVENAALLREGADFDPAVFNNPALDRNVRKPHYQSLGRRFIKLMNNYSIQPIDRMVEILDWDMTLGGLVEREVAHELHASVYRPAVVSHGSFTSLATVNPRLKQHARTLTVLGADTLVTKRPSLELIHVAAHQ